MKGPTHEIIEVTPELARKWLAEKNPGNRVISKSTVALYTRLMREGKWRFNGETIAFDTNGHLMNGQHRLTACVESGVTVTALVVRGLPPEVRNTIDQHRKRTASDVLGMAGIKDGNVVAGIARVVWQWDVGTRGASMMGGGQNMLAPDEVLTFLGTEPLILQAASAVRTEDAQRLAPSRPLGALWVLTHREDPDYAEEFYTRLTTGEMLKSGDPILTLRRYWINLSGRTKARTLRTGSSFNYLNAGVRAWNAWARGEHLQNIVWKNHNIPELASPRRSGSSDVRADISA